VLLAAQAHKQRNNPYVTVKTALTKAQALAKAPGSKSSLSLVLALACAC